MYQLNSSDIHNVVILKIIGSIKNNCCFFQQKLQAGWFKAVLQDPIWFFGILLLTICLITNSTVCTKTNNEVIKSHSLFEHLIWTARPGYLAS